jgi:hypothetical protein
LGKTPCSKVNNGVIGRTCDHGRKTLPSAAAKDSASSRGSRDRACLARLSVAPIHLIRLPR